jgi:hypothetical protein
VEALDDRRPCFLLSLTSCATTYPLHGERTNLDGGATLGVVSILLNSGDIVTDVDSGMTVSITHVLKPDAGIRFCRVEVSIADIPHREITIPFKQVRLIAEDGTAYQPIAVQMAGTMFPSFEFPAKYVEVLPNLEGKIGTSKTKEEVLKELQKQNPGMNIQVTDSAHEDYPVRLFYEVPEKAKLVRLTYFDQTAPIPVN